ncbi:unnamed protein product, partial [Nesidiocoris tenuis]
MLSDKSDGLQRTLDAILLRLDKLDVLENEMKLLKGNFEEDKMRVGGEIRAQNSKIVSMEVRMRRKNLIWYGIAESEGDPDHDVNAIVRLINEVLKIPCSTEVFLDVFRIGKPGQGRNRPICTEFKNHDFKWRVFNNKKNLYGSDIFLNLDLPLELRGNRNKRSQTLEGSGSGSREELNKGHNKRPPSSPANGNSTKKTPAPLFKGQGGVIGLPSTKNNHSQSPSTKEGNNFLQQNS